MAEKNKPDPFPNLSGRHPKTKERKEDLSVSLPEWAGGEACQAGGGRKKPQCDPLCGREKGKASQR